MILSYLGGYGAVKTAGFHQVTRAWIGVPNRGTRPGSEGTVKRVWRTSEWQGAADGFIILDGKGLESDGRRGRRGR
jgi:hypothetical protein